MTDSALVADLYDCSDPEGRAAGLDAAAAAIGAGKLVLLPTDTVYGVAADAFTPAAVTGLLAAKNRGRAMPVPVLIGEASTLGGLVVNLPPVANDLAQAFWPGGLTLVLEHAPSLAWDLGDAEARSPSACPTTTSPATCSVAPVRWRCPAPTGRAGRPRRRRRRRSTSWGRTRPSSWTADRGRPRRPARSSTAPAPSHGCCAWASSPSTSCAASSPRSRTERLCSSPDGTWLRLSCRGGPGGFRAGGTQRLRSSREGTWLRLSCRVGPGGFRAGGTQRLRSSRDGTWRRGNAERCNVI